MTKIGPLGALGARDEHKNLLWSLRPAPIGFGRSLGRSSVGVVCLKYQVVGVGWTPTVQRDPVRSTPSSSFLFSLSALLSQLSSCFSALPLPSSLSCSSYLLPLSFSVSPSPLPTPAPHIYLLFLSSSLFFSLISPSLPLSLPLFIKPFP